MTAYVDSGKARYEFRHFPLTSIHPQAQKAAEATECAGEQGRFWEMHDLLFGQQDRWSGQADALGTFKEMAGELGLDQARFDACLDGGAYAEKVAADQAAGIAAGVSGTPGFLINGGLLSGAQAFAAFQQQIEYYLAGGEPPKLEVAADSYRSRGEADAAVVVTEFASFGCSACGAVAQQVIPQLIARYVDTGKVRYVYREFPLNEVAQEASEAAVCAGQQGQYWAMNEKLFAAEAEWSATGADMARLFAGYAQEKGLDTAAFTHCLESGKAAVVVQGDRMAGEMLGVNATPYFFVNSLPIRGGLPIEGMGEVIEYVAAGGETPQILPQGEDFHLRGNTQTARAIAVAFVDYASAESAEHALNVLPELVKGYVDAGSLLYVLHPWADGANSVSAQAAAAAECAGQQGKFWEMHHQLFAEQPTWTKAAAPRELFSEYAAGLGLDVAALDSCLDSEWARLRVQAGKVVGRIYGVPGAPVFLFNNGQAQQGSPTFEEFKTILDGIVQ